MKVYKACKKSIVTMKLLPDSITNESRKGIIDHSFAKFRTNKVEILSIVNPLTGSSMDSDSISNVDIIYKIGEIVETSYNPLIEDDYYKQGISYTKTHEVALSWFYQNNPKTDGVYRGWENNGKIKYILNYKNGKKDGLQQGWYKNGQELFKRNYKNGNPEGLHQGWFENGNKYYEGCYKNGLEDGIHQRFYKNGNKKYEDNYKNGVKDGLQQIWNEDGKLFCKIYFKNGLRVNL